MKRFERPQHLVIRCLLTGVLLIAIVGGLTACEREQRAAPIQPAGTDALQQAVEPAAANVAGRWNYTIRCSWETRKGWYIFHGTASKGDALQLWKTDATNWGQDFGKYTVSGSTVKIKPQWGGNISASLSSATKLSGTATTDTGDRCAFSAVKQRAKY